MTEFVRPIEASFEGLEDYAFAPNWHAWQDLRMHYLDEGPREGPVVLMTHGMPTWSYLYRHVIPPLVAAGYRCIAPDHLGFGRSDKPLDIHWYTIARHTEVLTSLVRALDLSRITLMCQDWGGPTGLAQAAMMPERFERLVIMNTWLEHEGYEYSEAIRNWNRNWHEGGLFAGTKPDMGLLMAMTAGLLPPPVALGHLSAGTLPDPWPSDAAQRMHAAYSAPFAGLDDAAWNGARRFPRSIPLDSPDNGNAAAQALHYRTLLAWEGPSHFIWGCTDDVFTDAWGREWASRMHRSTYDPIEDAGHFLQNTHGAQIAEILLRRMAEA
jgi:haloalkane dehalogenase